ncbi:hypothetical protein [Microcoleus anatoxicus]
MNFAKCQVEQVAELWKDPINNEICRSTNNLFTVRLVSITI